jgi:hypothetical protein
MGLLPLTHFGWSWAWSEVPASVNIAANSGFTSVFFMTAS